MPVGHLPKYQLGDHGLGPWNVTLSGKNHLPEECCANLGRMTLRSQSSQFNMNYIILFGSKMIPGLLYHPCLSSSQKPFGCSHQQIEETHRRGFSGLYCYARRPLLPLIWVILRLTEGFRCLCSFAVAMLVAKGVRRVQVLQRIKFPGGAREASIEGMWL